MIGASDILLNDVCHISRHAARGVLINHIHSTPSLRCGGKQLEDIAPRLHPLLITMAQFFVRRSTSLCRNSKCNVIRILSPTFESSTEKSLFAELRNDRINCYQPLEGNVGL
jgi:hypothetical protein